MSTLVKKKIQSNDFLSFNSVFFFLKAFRMYSFKIYKYIFKKSMKKWKNAQLFLLLNGRCQVIFISWHHDKSLWTQTLCSSFFYHANDDSTSVFFLSSSLLLLWCLVSVSKLMLSRSVASSHFMPWEINSCVFSASFARIAQAQHWSSLNINPAVLGAKLG